MFQVVRWPWVLYGCFLGVWMSLRARQVVFRVTPKGQEQPASLCWKLLVPYVALVLVTYSPMLFVADAGPAKGYYFFLMLSQLIYVFSLFGIVLVHRYESTKQN